MRKALLFIFPIFALSLSAFAWEGKVASVIDGDTITILKDNGTITIRLYGIDCPESGQDFGSKATNFVTTMVNGKTVRVEDVDKDRYNRLVAKVYLPDGSCVNEKIIEAGLAWVYEEYCKLPECIKWRELQVKARKNQDGLWGMNLPTPPWEYRSTPTQTIPSQSITAKDR